MRRLFLVVATIVLGLTTAFAQPDYMAAIPADKDVRYGVLDNGMTYYIRNNVKPEGQAEFYIFDKVGAMQEDDSQDGLAHFLEHMAFNGTKNFPNKGIINYLETIGVKFGANLNAGTGQEMTVYNMSAVPTSREGIIDSCLLILHDWAYFISLDPKEVDKERGVIVEERRTRNSPAFRLAEITNKTLYNGTKYADRNVIGSEENLKNFKHETLKNFYHKWYRADNQAIVVVGDINVDAVEAKIKSLMANIPKVDNPEPISYISIPENEEPMVAVASDPEQTNSIIRLYIKREPLPRQMRDKVIATKLNTLISLVDAMMRNRLQEIMQRPNAPFVQAYVGNNAITSTCDAFMGIAMAREGEIDRAFEGLYTEVERVAKYQFTQGELERVIEDAYRSAEKSYDGRNDKLSQDYVWEYIMNYYQGTAYPDSKTAWQLDSTILKTTNITEVNTIAKQIITQKNQVVIVHAPKKEGVGVPTDQEIKAIMAKVKTAQIEPYQDNTVKEPLVAIPLKGTKVKKSLDYPYQATVWTLANGVKVIVKKTTFKADEVIFTAFANGGLSLVSDQEYTTGSMIEAFQQASGVGKFSMIDLNKQLSGKDVSLSPTIGNYDSGLRGKCSPKDLEELLQLAYLYMTEPRFDRQDYDVVMDKYKAYVSNMASNPNYIMQDTIQNTVYNNNPRRKIISPALLDKVNYDYIMPIYKKLFDGANNYTFVFVGAIDEDVLKPLVEKYIGSVPVSKTKLKWRDDQVRVAKGDVVNNFCAQMEAPKTTVFIQYSGSVKYDVKNLMVMDILKQILDLRCTESIREEKGGTYGVRVMSSLNPRPVEDYSLAFLFDTDPKLADELIPIIGKEVIKIANEGARADDLAKIKEYMLKAYKENAKKNNVWASYITMHERYGIDTYSDYEQRVNAITSDDMKAFASKIVKDNNIAKIVMSPKVN